jgi:transcriptional regulator with XRE-family HTH domain
MMTDIPDHIFNLAFGRCVRRWRKRQSINQDDLAMLLGRTQSFVSRLERGVTSITLVEAWRLLEVLGLTDDFMGVLESVSYEARVVAAVLKAETEARERIERETERSRKERQGKEGV